MFFKYSRLLASFAVAFFLVVSLSLTFAPDARAQNAEEIVQQANKLYREKNYTEAASLLRKTAEQGHAVAQYYLAWMYFGGKGIEQDEKQAAEWYRKAAEQGHVEAQNTLGRMYEKGKGVKQDDKQAAEWLHKAAEQGHSSAQYNLGRIYLNATSNQDKKQAAGWIRKAAEQRHHAALSLLSDMHLQGDGVKKDLPTAYALALLAGKDGWKFAQESALKIRKDLTTEQITAGGKIAREWEQRIQANRQKNP